MTAQPDISAALDHVRKAAIGAQQACIDAAIAKANAVIAEVDQATARGGEDGPLERPHKCKHCDAQATKAIIWADGRAFIPVCDEHEATARRIVEEQHDSVVDVVALPSKSGKGMLDGVPDGGVHVHAWAEEGGKTQLDGAHYHRIILASDVTLDSGETLEAGTVLTTQEDGAHEHPIGDDGIAEEGGSEHRHIVLLPDGTEAMTEIEGTHFHEPQRESTAFDGGHLHAIIMPDGSEHRTRAASEAIGEGETAPPAPPASELLDEAIAQAKALTEPDAEPTDKAAQVLLEYPDKRGPRRGVLQAHFRGASLHLDFRADLDGEQAIGWTIPAQKKGAVPKVETLEQAREIASAFDPEGNKHLKTLRTANRRVEPKQGHDLKWLRMDAKKIPAGEVGATKDLPAFIVAAAKPKVEWGVQSRDVHEYFLTQDDKFAGRLVFRRINADGEKLWVGGLTKSLVPAVVQDADGELPPLGQPGMPKALADAVPKELRFWEASSKREARDIRADLVDAKILTKDTVKLEGAQFAVEGQRDKIQKRDRVAKLAKAEGERDEEKRLVTGVILIPNEPDGQGDIYDESEVEKAAFYYMEHHAGTSKLMHEGQPIDGVVLLESWVSKQEESIGDETFPTGTWFVTFRVDRDDLWAAIKRGDITGFSMGGTARREPLTEAAA